MNDQKVQYMEYADKSGDQVVESNAKRDCKTNVTAVDSPHAVETPSDISLTMKFIKEHIIETGVRGPKFYCLKFTQLNSNEVRTVFIGQREIVRAAYDPKEPFSETTVDTLLVGMFVRLPFELIGAVIDKKQENYGEDFLFHFKRLRRSIKASAGMTASLQSVLEMSIKQRQIFVVPSRDDLPEALRLLSAIRTSSDTEWEGENPNQPWYQDYKFPPNIHLVGNENDWSMRTFLGQRSSNVVISLVGLQNLEFYLNRAIIRKCSGTLCDWAMEMLNTPIWVLPSQLYKECLLTKFEHSFGAE